LIGAAYGAMQLAGPWAVNAPPARASAVGVLRAAVAAGIDHIDTAQYYGPDVVNDLIREALYPYPRELAIVSKVGVRRAAGAVIPHGDARQLREDIEENLRSLRVGSRSRTGDQRRLEPSNIVANFIVQGKHPPVRQISPRARRSSTPTRYPARVAPSRGPGGLRPELDWSSHQGFRWHVNEQG
jgi:hypothetical protein